MPYPNATQDSASPETRWDIRSDTVTRPCAGMRQAMSEAEVGDDVLGNDPTTEWLEGTVAELLQKPAAMFIPSGTQSNFCAALSHTLRGEAIITGEDYHLYKYEGGGASVFGGTMFRPQKLRDDGSIAPSDIDKAVPVIDSHFAPSTLLSLENTINGKAIPLETFAEMVSTGRKHGLAVHLDGARYFNAVFGLDCQYADLANMVDSVSVCLSKGLGAPVGSVLAGETEFIAQARHWRKVVGGGMRQSGVLAAAGLYAIEHGMVRLLDDHRRTTRLAQFLQNLQLGTVKHATNMIFWELPDIDPKALSELMQQRGIAILADPTTRLVLHHQITDEAITEIQTAFCESLDTLMG